MILPKLTRAKLTKGVSLLALVAVAGIGFSNFESDSTSASMVGKNSIELEGIADPLFEELFQDQYNRQLEAYTESKGMFSCDDTCQLHKRRLNLVQRELSSIQAERAAARLALRQAAAAERKAALQAAAAERLANTQAQIAANQARRAATLLSAEERSAARMQARLDAREGRITPAEAEAMSRARHDARWVEYLNEVATSHGFPNWEAVEHFVQLTPEERAEIRDPGYDQNNGGILHARRTVRSAAREAQAHTPAPTTSPTPAPTTSPTSSPTSSPTTDPFNTSGAQNRLIIRHCPGCNESHRTIVYRRLTPVPEEFDYRRMFMTHWFTTFNEFHVDFELYSSVHDAMNQVNEWQFCNFNDGGVGFPRDCGPNGSLGHQWNPLQAVTWSTIDIGAAP